MLRGRASKRIDCCWIADEFFAFFRKKTIYDDLWRSKTNLKLLKPAPFRPFRPFFFLFWDWITGSLDHQVNGLSLILGLALVHLSHCGAPWELPGRMEALLARVQRRLRGTWILSLADLEWSDSGSAKGPAPFSQDWIILIPSFKIMWCIDDALLVLSRGIRTRS